MAKVDHYKLAPAHLYKEVTGGEDEIPNRLVVGDKVLEGRTFRDQEAVDRAWEEGWFGPPTLDVQSILLSEQDWDTKAQMVMAVENDARYVGLELRGNMTKAGLVKAASNFEGDYPERFE